ncbi:MAG: cation transporter [Clostridia bacterium]|nr:cation transporter [Clostridia bacterium]
MTKLLLKTFLKDIDTKEALQMRAEYSVFAGVLGIICNIVLFLLKLLVGISVSSIAIVSDAFNNLSDMGTSVISIAGAKLSAKKPDKEHPFGHGRIEYVFSLIVSFIIMLVGFELLKSSVTKIFAPEKILLNPILLVVLCISIPIKLWMYSYNKFLGKRINSAVLLAASRDSANDAIATTGIILSTVLGKLLGADWLDGAVGTIISLVIMYSGIKITVDTTGLLLGTPPQKETVLAIRDYALKTPGVTGVHDLIVHDYGPGRQIASLHVEVLADCDIVKMHEEIDNLEKLIETDLGIRIVVHMDPISANCEETANARKLVKEIVEGIDKRMGIHDFRMTNGENAINLIFDIEVPADFGDIDTAKKLISKKIKEEDPRFNAVINIDFIYD